MGAYSGFDPRVVAARADVAPLGARVIGRAFESDVPVPDTEVAARRRVVMIGGCQTHSLKDLLRGEFDCVQKWRRPTIALMSEPARSVGALGFDDRHSRYVLEDCAKTHLAELLAIECDALMFDLIRDVRSPLVRCGKTFIFDPNEMFHRILDARSPAERTVDVSALFGGSVIETLDILDPRFFDVWAAHFEQFYAAVLAPRLANGCLVIVQQVFLARQTVPPSDAVAACWDYCDKINALLRRMHAQVATYAGIQRISVDEADCLTAGDAPKGGPHITHPIGDVFACLADQTRAIIAPQPMSAARSTFAHLMRRTSELQAERAGWNAERHQLTHDVLAERAAWDVERHRLTHGILAERTAWDAERHRLTHDILAERAAWDAERHRLTHDVLAERAAWEVERHQLTYDKRCLSELLAYRTAAYETLRQAERRRLHRRTGRALRYLAKACRAGWRRLRPSGSLAVQPGVSTR